MGVAGGIATALFGVFWCIAAGAMGAWFMIPFGLIFVGISVYSAIYNYHNLTSKDRYSIVDIVDEDEETDPLNVKYGKTESTAYSTPETRKSDIAYCPYCGTSVRAEFDFCPKCGKSLL